MLSILSRRVGSPARLAGVVGIVTLGVGCSGDGPAKVTVAASVDAANIGATFTGTVGAALPVAPTFIVKDAAGNALAGKGVTISVTAGGGTITGAPTTSAAGATSVGIWKLGNIAGTNTITVAVAGVPTLTFNATGAPDVPIALTLVSGDAQSVAAGTAITQSLNAKVADKFGNGVPGQSVTFAVTAGGGSVASASAVLTDANGIAIAPAWTLGKSNVAQQLTISSGSLAALATASVATSYAIDLRQYGATISPAIAASVQTAFTSAAARLTAAVTGGVTPATIQNLSTTASACGITGTVAATTISVPGVVIYYAVEPIDGVGAVLGSAYPCIARDNRGLTVLGVMRFDDADIAGLVSTGRLNDVIMHEMLHVLGFGTLWTYVLPNLSVRAGTVRTAFTGVNAINACVGMGGGIGVCLDSIPLENTGGAGTTDSHWRESIFKSELMTGFISGTTRPLSTMTIASMQDLGYTVNMASADQTTVGALLSSVRNPFSLQAESASTPFGEILQPLRFTVNAAGELKPIAGRP